MTVKEEAHEVPGCRYNDRGTQYTKDYITAEGPEQGQKLAGEIVQPG